MKAENIVKARIKNKIVTVHLVADKKGAYKLLKKQKSIKYLGKGKYHTINDIEQGDPRSYHFWKYI